VSTHVLVVDDESRMAEVMASALGRAGHACRVCTSAAAALASLEEHGADVVVTDWRMPDMDGVALMKAIHERRPSLPVILVTAHGSVPAAVAAMREGAFDYVTKPFDNDELRALVARALDLSRLERENRFLREEVRTRYGPETIVAESAQSRSMLDLVRRVAPSRAAVLVQGESGTGKELVARLLHYWSDRVGKPFVAVNVKAFAESVIESELFGHERGAFTGAVAAKAGCFERAHGGTLFLDEIGEIGGDVQAKLLRVVQEGEVLPVGGTRPRRVDVRLVTATNRVLRDEIAAGRFREDLYFRLNVIPVHLTALRERRDDIVPLARHFLARHAAEVGRRLALSSDAEEVLRRHAWPGNVRELENAIERAVVLARGETIAPEDLLLEEPAAGGPPTADGTLQECLDVAAVARIRGALATAGGERTAAAKALGVDRTTLYRLMRRLGL
jgi:DNA-binding NtrC family response regulator